MTPEENDMLTRVGPGTPGGEMLRRYWWPVWFAEKIEGKPVPVRLLGEDFVLFRDGRGEIGMLDPVCAHRRECRGMQKNLRAVYKHVEDGWWGLASEDQDRAAQESQGFIHDRSREFLGTSDRGVVMWRKLAFNSIAAAKAGRDPHGIVRRGDDNDRDGNNLAGKEVIRFDSGKNFSDHDKSPVAAS